MSHNHSSIRSKDVSIDVLVDFTKKLYSSDKTRKLDNVTDNKEKIYILHEIVSGKIENKRIEENKLEFLIEDIKDKLSDAAAKRYIEEGIKREVIKRMETREIEYLNEMKLQVIKKHAGLENASTLKKYADLELMKKVRLTKSIMDVMRPQRQDEIIGQENAVSALISKIASPFPQHVILYGPPGVGKTTTARLALEIAKSRKHTPFSKTAKFVEVDATTLRWDPKESINPLLGSVHDPIFQGANKELAEMGIPEPKPGLVTEAHGGVLFIDEIGELDVMLQNKLLKVLEDKKVRFDSSYYDVNNENIPRYIKLLFEEGAPADFILIGATTRQPEEINPALRSRCAEVFFNPLSSSDIARIVLNAADKLGARISAKGAELISSYTYEARKAVNILADCYSSMINEREDKDIEISVDCIKEVLSKGRYVPLNKKKAEGIREIGRINGLGVNGFIGNVIELEAVCFAREDEAGTIRFNETAGSMTKDSLFNALSVIRKITDKNINKYDIHVNCVGGGKVDGPSAGAAITCLLYSAILERPARQDTCITGEISIRGRIKAVGGIVEKISGAKRAGFKNVIIPEENKEEANGLDGINIIPAGNIQEVIGFMFDEQ
ncbi:MAG TPA: Lon family ATP-dependent protease [Bacillota bacterium]|nr:Lon family ATP-dependent protease [Bacillota bacterium]HNT03036.1 Lon family ATP-dependent protease [Bacillota bacterium]HNU79370.1 Lon family ATP-dependent protease [Bacillota bacterium]HPA54674.1 Lon family ATP-dependent protease [Bacillota bacterium]HPL99368.1 Lon family ATP-dependent protease [Bacillota bacterium]